MTEPGQIFFYIDSGEYAFLDNFYPCRLVIDGIEYGSVEHYYQSQKAANPSVRELVRSAPTPAEAKALASSIKGDEKVGDWDAIKVGVMRRALLAKFTQNESLRARLLGTGDAVLHENSPDDMFWGVRGSDMLGRLLMELRGKLGKE